MRYARFARTGAALGTTVLVGSVAGLAPAGAVVPVDQPAGWVQLAPAASPPGRYDAAMAYDSRSRSVVLFGGQSDDGLGTVTTLGDTWTWDGRTWTRRSVAGPSARSGAALGTDPRARRLLLFGGLDAVGARLGDTWAWRCGGWRLIAAGRSDGPSGPGSMAYDRSRRQLVLVTEDDRGVARTWRWSHRRWVALGTPDPTVGRGVVVYDRARKQLLMQGTRTTESNVPSGDLFRWTGSRWVRSGSALAVVAPAAAYDPRRRQVVSYGGASYDGPESWTSFWDGSTLRAVQDDPAAGKRAGASLVYDRAHRQLLLFGGFGGTPETGYQSYSTTWVLPAP